MTPRGTYQAFDDYIPRSLTYRAGTRFQMIDEWLDEDSPNFNQALSDAVFHYSPRTGKDSRFEACIATEDMKQATWKYAHNSQILLDGTFGICDAKILLFIVMAVDENNRGVPLAFLLFSAPSENRHTAAGYDTAVLSRLLERWREMMGERNGELFNVSVAITDTDLMERGALLAVFPSVWLLICQFHLRQSWKNHRAKVIKGSSPDHATVKARLRALEDALVAGEDYAAAKKLIKDEISHLSQICAAELEGQGGSAPEPTSYGAAAGGIEHLNYLDSYWMREALWRSWSRFGRRAASELLKWDINAVTPTTNHLEAFNGVFKRKHLRRWQKGGRLLRLDVIVHTVATKILPSIFKQRSLDSLSRQT